MGIDIYAKWKNQSKEEEKAQFTGFSTVAGSVGYLREAYHGEPYVTHYLVEESFKEDGAKIPAKVLRERLPAAVMLSIVREAKLYSKERDKIRIEDTGKLLNIILDIFNSPKTGHKEIVEQFTPETLKHVERMIEEKILPKYAQSFVDFVELCEKKEKETGEPCVIEASY